MAGFISSPGVGGGRGEGFTLGSGGIPIASSSGNSFLDSQTQIIGSKIINGEISDSGAIAHMLTILPTLKDYLTNQALVQASNFNPSALPAWVKILVGVVPALGTILARTIGGGGGGGNTISNSPGTPGNVGAGAAPSPSTGNSSTTPVQTSDIAGRPFGDNAILPGVVPPLNPELQAAWNNFLTQNIGKGIAPYPGQINAPINKNLQQTWQNFNPDITKIPGAAQIAAALPSLFAPKTNPILAQMMLSGSPNPTSPLAGFASGALTGPAQFLAPFLMNNVPGGYAAPNVPIRPVSIGG